MDYQEFPRSQESKKGSKFVRRSHVKRQEKKKWQQEVEEAIEEEKELEKEEVSEL